MMTRRGGGGTAGGKTRMIFGGNGWASFGGASRIMSGSLGCDFVGGTLRTTNGGAAGGTTGFYRIYNRI